MRNEIVVADAQKLPWADKSLDCIIGSPPYTDRRDYGIKAHRPLAEWLIFMVNCTIEAVRVSKGPILWVINGKMLNGHYEPSVELLMARLWELNTISKILPAHLERPLIWHKNFPHNRDNWWENAWEYILPIVPYRTDRYFNWQVLATLSKYESGGVFRQRNAKGIRNIGDPYVRSKECRPTDVIRATVGGGHMGSPLASENEAPFPESLVEQLLPAICPPEGIVGDPFCGSGTTGAVAKRLNRAYALSDIRESQVDLSIRRINNAIHK